jgi:hypothetical protein
MSGTTITNLPDGTSQAVFSSANLNPGVLSEVDNYSGPNATGILTSTIDAFTNGSFEAFSINDPSGFTRQVDVTYSGTGIAFEPGAASNLNALGTNAFTVAATNPTISEVIGLYNPGPGKEILTGGFNVSLRRRPPCWDSHGSICCVAC